MALTKADFIEIGRRVGLTDEQSARQFEAYTKGMAGAAEAFGKNARPMDDAAAKKDIEILMRMHAVSQHGTPEEKAAVGRLFDEIKDEGDRALRAAREAQTQKKGFFSKMFGRKR